MACTRISHSPLDKNPRFQAKDKNNLDRGACSYTSYKILFHLQSKETYTDNSQKLKECSYNRNMTYNHHLFQGMGNHMVEMAYRYKCYTTDTFYIFVCI